MNDVIIVGGGPVGLLLACELKLAGADPLVLEAAAGEERRTRSLGLRSLSARTVQSLALRGLVELVEREQWEMLEGLAGRREPAGADVIAHMIELLRKGQVRGHFSGLPLTEEGGGAEYLMLKQHRLEAILAEHAAGMGVRIWHGCTVTDVTQDSTGAVATLADGRAVRGAYLVGCDGGRSLVRKRTGIAFDGTPATMTGRTAVATLADPGMIASSLRSPGGLVTLSLVPGEIATLEFDGGPGDRDAPMTAAELQDSLRRVSGRDVVVERMETGIRYSDNTRHARTYQEGRMLLAGDAAHVHSPLGGQGLNLGLQDAVNLGWRLGLVVRGLAPESLLDGYTSERHPVAARVLRNTRAQVALMRPGAQVDALREVLAEVLGLEEARRHFAGMVDGTETDYAPGSANPLVGRFVPATAVTGTAVTGTAVTGTAVTGTAVTGTAVTGTAVTGTAVTGTAVTGMAVTGMAVTGMAVTGMAELSRDGRGLLVGLDRAGDLGAVLAGHRDRVGPAWAATGAEFGGASALLVRPDGYVAWAGDLDGAGDALTTWFGPPTRPAA
ncbi:FAD-dependent monooxygenase [Nonomuraea insulae]|uniref:FAD-dependent monooxygenase n=1 Tax=Nonomuraea insulae TaxID=1616787 RepID=A0ABW1D220_9ACTN